MATTKQVSSIKLTEEEMQDVRKYILHSKLQHRAILYANISYAKFRNVIDHGSGMTKRQYSRLIEFCKSTKTSNVDF